MEVKELEKCKSDPIYFLEKYCTVIDKNTGVERQIKFKKYQKEQFYHCLVKTKEK